MMHLGGITHQPGRDREQHRHLQQPLGPKKHETKMTVTTKVGEIGEPARPTSPGNLVVAGALLRERQGLFCLARLCYCAQSKPKRSRKQVSFPHLCSWPCFA